jgi:hypothetical protein
VNEIPSKYGAHCCIGFCSMNTLGYGIYLVACVQLLVSLMEAQYWCTRSDTFRFVPISTRSSRVTRFETFSFCISKRGRAYTLPVSDIVSSKSGASHSHKATSHRKARKRCLLPSKCDVALCSVPPALGSRCFDVISRQSLTSSLVHHLQLHSCCRNVLPA